VICVFRFVAIAETLFVATLLVALARCRQSQLVCPARLQRLQSAQNSLKFCFVLSMSPNVELDSLEKNDAASSGYANLANLANSVRWFNNRFGHL
jgi:hypothetical protein